MTSVRFHDFAERNANATAIVDPEEKHWSRGELNSLLNRLSRGMRELGLVEGDVLAILAPNTAEYLATYLAATQIGLYVVPVNWHLAPPEIAYILEDSGAKALVAHERVAACASAALPLMSASPPILVSFGTIPGFTSVDHVISGLPDTRLPDSVAGRVLSYTSATTGKPKGVKLSLQDASRVTDQAVEARIARGLELEKHVHLNVSMLYHGAPLEAAVIALHMGHLLVLIDALVPELVLRLVDKYQVTSAYMVPSMFSRLLRLDESTRRKFSMASLRRVVHTGAPCPVHVKRRMLEWWGPVIWEAYAGAEGGGTLVGPEEWLKYPGTVGKAIPGARLKILDDSGNELPPGEVGAIYMTRYTGDRFEYKGDRAKTDAAYRGDFFTLGDIGYLNEEGYLFICDRKTDMIISYGMNIYSAEIEQVLLRHPRVADCAVFGVPHEFAGEIVVAAIRLEDESVDTRELSTEIQKFLAGHLSLAKLPRRIVYIAESLRDATGKPIKKRLRAQYAGAAPVEAEAPR